MKTLIAFFLTLTLITVTGCMNTSSKGGISPTYEQFSITVPSSMTIKQGATEPITVSLNRGVDFKQDVQLYLKANDVTVTPASILVKSGDNPDVKVQITAIKKSTQRENALIIRLFEPTGQSGKTKLKLPALDIEHKVELGAFEVKTLEIDLNSKKIKEVNMMER